MFVCPFLFLVLSLFFFILLAYETEGHTGMKVNKELLAKLRADRGAILEGEFARKKQKLGGEAKGTDDQGIVIFEMPSADEGMKPKEAINTAAFLSKSAGKKPLNIEEPSIKVDPKEADNRLSNFQGDMRKLDELPDKELYEKCLASLGEVYTSLPLIMQNLAILLV